MDIELCGPFEFFKINLLALTICALCDLSEIYFFENYFNTKSWVNNNLPLNVAIMINLIEM